MPLIHVLLALLVVLIWGLNFIFVKLSLDVFSPLFLCALRFFLASVPAVFFIKPPATSFKMLVLYGMVMFAMQFSFLFLGMNSGMMPGMASLIIQVQIFFSIFLAAVILGEKPRALQLVGAVVSFSGIMLVALHLDSTMSVAGFLFILAAAMTWGVGNLITKQIKNVSVISLVIWGCFVACLPMFLVALIVEGPESIVYSTHHLTSVGVTSMMYVVYVSTWVGYGVWNWLLSRYPVSMIVPFALLVPVVGILSSVIFLGESFELWKLTAGLLVISGLYINLMDSRVGRQKGLQEAA